MIGQIEIVGFTAYMHVNNNGTLEKLNPMSWWYVIILYVKSKFNKLTIAEVRDYVNNHQKGHK